LDLAYLRCKEEDLKDLDLFRSEFRKAVKLPLETHGITKPRILIN
jgi:hypothetical protein